MSAEDNTDYRKELNEFERELNDEEKAWRLRVRTQLITWLIRWGIGFAVIGLIYSYRPDWTWLWWMGIAIALASLVFTLVMDTVMRRRFRLARQRLVEANAFAKCLDSAGR